MRKHRKAWRVPELSVLLTGALLTLGLVSAAGGTAQAAQAANGAVP
jgi:hypothetical protein